MKLLDKDKGTMLACNLASSPTLESPQADTMVSMNLSTLQAIAKTRYHTVKHRPGRLGYSRDTKAQAVNQWRASDVSMATVANNFDITPATVKRWITEANATKKE